MSDYQIMIFLTMEAPLDAHLSQILERGGHDHESVLFSTVLAALGASLRGSSQPNLHT